MKICAKLYGINVHHVLPKDIHSLEMHSHSLDVIKKVSDVLSGNFLLIFAFDHKKHVIRTYTKTKVYFGESGYMSRV